MLNIIWNVIHTRRIFLALKILRWRSEWLAAAVTVIAEVEVILFACSDKQKNGV
jgi:hypothetical protein